MKRPPQEKVDERHETKLAFIFWGINIQSKTRITGLAFHILIDVYQTRIVEDGTMPVVAQFSTWNYNYASNCNTQRNQIQKFTSSTNTGTGKACHAAHLTKHSRTWKSLVINSKMIKPGGVIDSSSCVKIHPHATFKGNTVPKGKLQTLEINIEEEKNPWVGCGVSCCHTAQDRSNAFWYL